LHQFTDAADAADDLPKQRKAARGKSALERNDPIGSKSSETE